jgi:ATP-dependent protease ClpP protease subunit
MPNHASGQRFFINDLDNEDVDLLLLSVAEAIFEGDIENSLEFWINSEGGDASRAFALVELIYLAQRKGFIVETFVLCDAYSAGSIVAVAGSKGYRWVARDASYMLHYGEAENTATSPIAAERIGKETVRHFLKVLNHYEHNCHIPDLETKLMFDNYYIHGDLALQYGLADGFLDEYPN